MFGKKHFKIPSTTCRHASLNEHYTLDPLWNQIRNEVKLPSELIFFSSRPNAGLLKWRPVCQIRPADHTCLALLSSPIYIVIHRTMVIIWPSDIFELCFGPLWPTRKNYWEPLANVISEEGRGLSNIKKEMNKFLPKLKNNKILLSMQKVGKIFMLLFNPRVPTVVFVIRLAS